MGLGILNMTVAASARAFVGDSYLAMNGSQRVGVYTVVVEQLVKMSTRIVGRKGIDINSLVDFHMLCILHNFKQPLGKNSTALEPGAW